MITIKISRTKAAYDFICPAYYIYGIEAASVHFFEKKPPRCHEALLRLWLNRSGLQHYRTKKLWLEKLKLSRWNKTG
jgi:hypothetical protein